MSSVVEASSPNLVESKSSAFQPWLVVFSAALFFFFEFMQLNMFNALNPYFIKAFSVSAAQLGSLSANYFYATVLFLIPAGLLLDRFSTRKILIIAMLICLLCTFAFAASHVLWQAALCRFITGLGASFCLLSCVRLASRWFPPHKMALVIGLVVTFAMVGGMVAQAPFTLLSDSIGWRNTLFLDAGVGVLMWFMIIACVRDYPPEQAKKLVGQQEHVQSLGMWRSLFLVLKNLQNWLAGLYTSLINLPIFLLGAMWGSMYLVQIRHLTRPQASVVTSMIFIGTIVGSPLLGNLSDRIGRRRLPMVVGAILSLCTILLLMYAPHLSMISLIFTFLALGFFTSVQIISYPLVVESNPLALTGVAESIASVLIMAGGFSQPFFGWLMGLHWQHTMVNNLPVYSVSDFRLAFAIMPVGFIIALLATWRIRETYCKSLEGIKDN